MLTLVSMLLFVFGVGYLSGVEFDVGAADVNAGCVCASNLGVGVGVRLDVDVGCELGFYVDLGVDVHVCWF